MTVEQDWTPQKRDFLQSTGHVLAMGGPGSGKTHVALVKARDEIRSAKLLSGQRILFLSFARPTVARVLEKAKELITADDLRLLDVNTYHGFAWSVLRSHGYLLSNGKPPSSYHLPRAPRAWLTLPRSSITRRSCAFSMKRAAPLRPLRPVDG